MINMVGSAYYCCPSKKDSQPKMYSNLAKEELIKPTSI